MLYGPDPTTQNMPSTPNQNTSVVIPVEQRPGYAARVAANQRDELIVIGASAVATGLVGGLIGGTNGMIIGAVAGGLLGKFVLPDLIIKQLASTPAGAMFLMSRGGF